LKVMSATTQTSSRLLLDGDGSIGLQLHIERCLVGIVQEVAAAREAEQRAQQAAAELQQSRRRADALEKEVMQLRPASIRQAELEARLSDRDQRLEKLRIEVRSPLSQTCA
jgi:hypothetical protein